MIAVVQWRIDAGLDALWRECKHMGIDTDCIEVLEPLDEYDSRIGRVVSARLHDDPRARGGWPEPHPHEVPLALILDLVRALPADSCMLYVAITGHETGSDGLCSTWASIGDLYPPTDPRRGSEMAGAARVYENAVSGVLAARVQAAIDVLVG